MKGKTGKPSAMRGGGMARKGVGMALKGGGIARKGTGSSSTPGGKVAKMAMGGMSGGRGPAAITSANINKPSNVAPGRPNGMPNRGSGTNDGGPTPTRNIGVKGPIKSPGGPRGFGKPIDGPRGAPMVRPGGTRQGIGPRIPKPLIATSTPVAGGVKTPGMSRPQMGPEHILVKPAPGSMVKKNGGKVKGK